MRFQKLEIAVEREKAFIKKFEITNT